MSIVEIIANPNKKGSASHNFRSKRFEFFKSLLNELPRPLKILDIGGTQSFWDSMNFNEPDVEITLLNLEIQKTTHPNFKSVKGNATKLSEYSDKSFDVVFSNSVIEHLFTKENQVLMAKEVRRVGKNYFIQTPNYWFPIEPHWVFPLFQYLPFSLKVFLTNNFSLGHIKKIKDKEKAIEQVKEIRLLTLKEMKELFPDAKIYLEKFFGFNKSLVAYKFENS